VDKVISAFDALWLRTSLIIHVVPRLVLWLFTGMSARGQHDDQVRETSGMVSVVCLKKA
jgi:hypothetical protein